MARITPDVPQRGGARNLLNVVDTYYRPARDRMGEAAMSQGLNAASNVANTMARKGIQEDIKEAEIKAKADAEAGEGPDAELKEVRLGNLFRPHSKAYNMVYSEAMGTKAAIEFNENATIEYEKSGLKYNTDPEKYREWWNGKVNSFLKDPAHQNTYFLAGAMNRLQQHGINMGAAHMSNVSAQMERNHLASIQKQADELSMSVGSGEVPTDKGLESLLSNVVGKGYATGLTGSATRKAFLASWLTAADATENTEMLKALSDAQESGAIKLTPKELNAVKDQSMNIERDIAFRQEQRRKALEAQEKAASDLVSDIVTDFYLKTENMDVPFNDFLQQPAGDTGKTMAEVIAEAPNSSQIMSEAKTAFTTMNTVNTIDATQEARNALEIQQARDEGAFNDPKSFLDWADKSGLRLNDENIKGTITDLQKANDPDGAYGTEVYKKGRSQYIQRIADTMNGSDAITFGPFGDIEGELVPTISLQFDKFFSDRVKAFPDGKANDPDTVAAALAAAEADTMAFFRATERQMFDKAFEDYNNTREEGTGVSNPYMEKEELRLKEEQRVRQEAEDEAVQNEFFELSSEATPFTRPDLEAQAAAIEILKIEEAAKAEAEASMSDYEKWKSMSRAERREAGLPLSAIGGEIEFRRFMAGIKGEDVPSRTELREREEADRQGAIEADKQMLEEVSVVVEDLNAIMTENVTDEQVSQILNDLQQRFNVTVPTSYQEIKFLAEDLVAIQEETGLVINRDVVERILKAAMDRF